VKGPIGDALADPGSFAQVDSTFDQTARARVAFRDSRALVRNERTLSPLLIVLPDVVNVEPASGEQPKLPGSSVRREVPVSGSSHSSISDGLWRQWLSAPGVIPLRSQSKTGLWLPCWPADTHVY